MLSDDQKFFSAYIHGVGQALLCTPVNALGEAANALYRAWKENKPVLFCGNGGSGASCSHIVNDFQKNIGIDYGKPLKALCLNDSMPLVSAWANDTEWQNVFRQQVRNWAELRSVLVVVSGSGNSENILNAVNMAYGYNCTTIGLTGFDGGLLKGLVDISLHVPTDSMQQAEDVHMILLHLLFLMLGRRIAANG